MVAIQVSERQYLVQGNDQEDFVNVKVGRQFLESDTRVIKIIEAKPHPNFTICYLVTMSGLA